MHSSTRPSIPFPGVDIVPPALLDSGVLIGQVQHLHLEIPCGRQGRVRLAEGSYLRGTVVLQNPEPGARARIWTDAINEPDNHDFQWFDLIQDAVGHWHLELPLLHTGCFFFTFQYTLDGKQWYWQSGTYWQLLVYPKQLAAMRMFTLIPTASGPLHHWEKILRDAAGLGFNMIHILPLTTQGHSQSPYAAKELFEIDPDLLDPASPELKNLEFLVQLAQSLELGLCLDLVLNHVAIDSTLAQRCPHWIVPDQEEADGMKRAGFLGVEGFHKWNDLALIHYNHPDQATRKAIWNYMGSYAMFWAAYAAATRGMIRLDNLHSTPPSFASHITRTIRSKYPQLGILAELFSTHEATQQMLVGYEVDLLLATTWEHHFSQELRRYFRYLHDSAPQIPWFTPVNSHDSGVPAEEFADVAATKPRYVLSTLLGTGTAGMTQGVELGILTKINFIGRNPSLQYAPGVDFRGLIKKTNELLETYSAFQLQGNLQFIDSNHPAIIAALRNPRDPSEPHGLVIANLDIHQKQSLTLDLRLLGLQAHRFRDAFTNQIFTHDSQVWNCELEPCGYQVLICE